MFNPIELFIGLRYTRAKRRNGFISFISLVSIIGIILGVMALIIVLSVMNGFEKEVSQRILSMISDITVSGYDGKLNDWQKVIDQVKKEPDVTGTAPYIRAEGMLIYRSEVHGAMFRGVNPKLEKTVSQVAKHMLSGKLSDLKPGKFNIILGQDLAFRLGVDVGDKVTMVTPSANITPAGVLPRLKRFTVSGIFKVGFYEYDSSVGLVNLQDAARVFRMGQAVTGVQVQVKNLFNVGTVRDRLKNQYLMDYWVKDWRYYHANWFKAVKMEKTMISLLLFLIILVAAINIVSSLIMVVTDKRSDIAILRTLGARTQTITRIFIIQGSVIGVVGTLLGTLFGVIISLNLESMYTWLEHVLHRQLIDGSVYLISTLPSDLQWHQVLWISGASLTTSILATIIPARRAAKTQPAEALRYE
ncbi:MAG: lipoprotein-releasing ABC transporter permease subunit [Gammaproteobacteria bacterium]|jgi:lipoprotein-releasing system permease protein